jgi:sialate O-acetylesterase
MKKQKTPPTGVAFVAVISAAILSTSSLRAELRLPSIFGDHMVLQRDIELRVRGWDVPGQDVSVSIAGQSATGRAGSDGKWTVQLAPLALTPHALRMTLQGSTRKVLTNVQVGEVWICSGQSNMAWPVDRANDPALEKAAADFPDIRLISVPQVGTQEAQDDFNGFWEPCTPESVGGFSAVGYFFGRQLHQTLGVPIGLIDNAWGGSAAEAWIRRDVLEKDSRFNRLMASWKEQEAPGYYDRLLAEYAVAHEAWKGEAERLQKEGKEPPRSPRRPRNRMTGNSRPANIYNGVLHPTIGFGIRGAIWYQGESNASRAYEYRDLFPLMIQHWRDEWNQGDFPFYWVQLADFRAETATPGDSDWAELREAQTLTLDKLPHTGQAVIIDLGEAHDIHPRDKQNVAKRLARWALAKNYGVQLVFQSPCYKAMKVAGAKAVVEFQNVGGGMDTFDVREPKGFAICGTDRQWHWANAKITGAETIEVWSDTVAAPVAVRYAWTDNPVANLQNKEGLPLTPFRTDDFPMITKPEG